MNLYRAKRVRFPKGKKVKPGDEVVDKGNVEEGEVDLMNPQVAAKAAKERANLRNQFTAELFSEDTGGIGIDLSVGEVTYEVCFEVFFKFSTWTNFFI